VFSVTTANLFLFGHGVRDTSQQGQVSERGVTFNDKEVTWDNVLYVKTNPLQFLIRDAQHEFWECWIPVNTQVVQFLSASKLLKPEDPIPCA
jgi:hypothetical protein